MDTRAWKTYQIISAKQITLGAMVADTPENAMNDWLATERIRFNQSICKEFPSISSKKLDEMADTMVEYLRYHTFIKEL